MTNTNIFHVIKDPVHGTMQFTTMEDRWIKPFIDSPNFQRLRHIKQLGMGDYIFPGAVHSRFNHCLGCSYVASQIANKIGLAEEERQLVMIACLIHDIGHGPFSHAFEDIFHEKMIRHEDWTPFFLADYRHSDFFASYNRHNPRHHLTEEKFNLIEDMIMHRPAHKHVLADIVSSQLDADRLDYLLRDSHFCGVRYGEFDFRWMLHCMAIVETENNERLGITHKGIGVVEHYLMARRLMTRNIYHSHKKLALEFFLIQFLTHLAKSIDDFTYFAPLKTTRLGKFLSSAQQLNHLAKNFSDTHKIKQDFLKTNYPIYKELNDYDVFYLVRALAEMPHTHSAIDLAKRIQHRCMPKIIRLEAINIARAKTLLDEFKNQHRNHFQDWQLHLIKTPHQAYSGDEDPILVVNEHEEVQPIEQSSFMISAISDKYETTTFLCIDQFIAEDERVTALIKKIREKKEALAGES